MKQKIKLGFFLGSLLLVLTACQAGKVTSSSSGLWERFVYMFAEIIRFLSFNSSIGVGIIFFTVIVRTIMLPVFKIQEASSRKMRIAQPRIRSLRLKYPGRDMDSRSQLAKEIQGVYKELDINPCDSFFPLLVQIPVMLALFQALTRVEFLKIGSFLWFNMAQADPYYILSILAAVFSFLNVWLNNQGLENESSMVRGTPFILSIVILLVTLNMASGVTLYWVVSSAYQVIQFLIFNNPFKITAKCEHESNKRRAFRKAHKKSR